MLGAPVPAFPAIRVPHLLGKAPHHIEEPSLVAVRGMDGLAFAVPVSLHQDGKWAVLFMLPFHFVGDDSGGFFPGNSLILAFTAILGVSLAVGVPIDPLQGVLNPIRGIGPFLISQR